jgi:protein arginine N-methyltransferase 3
MSYRVPVARAPSSAGTSSESDSDERCSDWESSLGDARQTQSLFDSTVLPTPEAALEHDRSVHQFDLSRFVEDKGLDVYGRMRLINHIRKTVGPHVEGVVLSLQTLSPKAAATLSGKEDLFKDDELLIPVLADDPLLRKKDQRDESDI